MVKIFLYKYRHVFIHAGSLLIPLGVPVLFNDFHQPGKLAGMLRNWLPLISFALVFYVNYLFLIDKYFFTKKHIHFVVLNVVMFTIIIVLMHLMHEFVWKNFELSIDKNRPRPSEFYIFYSQFFSLVISSVVSIAVKVSKEKQQDRKREKRY